MFHSFCHTLVSLLTSTAAAVSEVFYTVASFNFDFQVSKSLRSQVKSIGTFISGEEKLNGVCQSGDLVYIAVQVPNDQLQF